MILSLFVTDAVSTINYFLLQREFSPFGMRCACVFPHQRRPAAPGAPGAPEISNINYYSLI